VGEIATFRVPRYVRFVTEWPMSGTKYVEAAVAAGLARDGGPGQLSDALVGQVAEAVRPVRPGATGRGGTVWSPAGRRSRRG
jgi:hypothetical protein